MGTDSVDYSAATGSIVVTLGTVSVNSIRGIESFTGNANSRLEGKRFFNRMKNASFSKLAPKIQFTLPLCA